MSKTDVSRWSDWRSTRRQPLRPVRRCKCGNEFLPDVDRQVTCRVCCGLADAAERAPFTADEIEQQVLDRLLMQALEEDAQHKPVPAAEPASDQAKLWRKASRRSSPPAKHHRKAKKPPRGMTKQMAKVALKSVRSGMSVRKIAKRLNVDEQVVRDWAILTADDMRYRAACNGKYQVRRVEAEVLPDLGSAYWTTSKQESRCPECRKMIFVGEQISRPGRRWIHATCAATMGFTVLNKDGSVAELEAA